MIFTTFTATFPDWSNKHLADDEKRLMQKRLWRYALNDLTVSHVKNGIENMVKSCEFPPRPATFRRLCFEVKGVPDLNTAFTEALSGNYSHKLVKRAAQLTGVFDLRHGTEYDAGLRKRYEYNHGELVKKLINGESIDGPVTKAIEHTQETASVGVCDDLIKQGIQTQRASGKSGYEAFLEAKKNLRG